MCCFNMGINLTILKISRCCLHAVTKKTLRPRLIIYLILLFAIRLHTAMKLWRLNIYSLMPFRLEKYVVEEIIFFV